MKNPMSLADKQKAIHQYSEDMERAAHEYLENKYKWATR